jgi:hypothetical protein
MKRTVTFITAMALSFSLATPSFANLVVNTCKSNVRDRQVVVVKGDKENEQTVTITEKGGYIIGLKVDEKDEPKGVKVGLAKQPGKRVQYEQAVTEKLEVEFKDLEPGTYRIVIVRPAKETKLAKDAK